MMITVELSMYPLDADYKLAIRAFIHKLSACDGLETVTNQMSTQVRGEFDDVMPAITACLKQGMSDNDKVVFVTKFLNSGLDITQTPDLV
ncbi:MAG: YkoF family thiamine/hydroxymethylpyrimidine-binding protein [Gammaproteobacteria bacterium]|jgi:uncharacterized protein YqgV (UPF0045/DUF77 family)|nr:hypothetical protein [Chromatiales bacterium]MCP4925868.1 hypothetical protein [Gammaproteobacteria bacterium]MDP7296664.1 YkoF family thiamine/hydroxymethylpyrimidine-binding protein [Gammaproteobacteria bacterium]MDP7419635.1 YkoF family thiamine/hydroxymethylpyrimidine-binding protein [Gammaproteobacteria bacterium]MDP7660259.1 YkoF family thiamine/hydroxymethylpyrimidine-binding protein [Gammaproteobacteria bacterium]